jgi:hypothetical protein
MKMITECPAVILFYHQYLLLGKCCKFTLSSRGMKYLFRVLLEEVSNLIQQDKKMFPYVYFKGGVCQDPQNKRI